MERQNLVMPVSYLYLKESSFELRFIYFYLHCTSYFLVLDTVLI